MQRGGRQGLQGSKWRQHIVAMTTIVIIKIEEPLGFFWPWRAYIEIEKLKALMSQWRARMENHKSAGILGQPLPHSRMVGIAEHEA